MNVRLRQLLDRALNRLFAIPLLCVLIGVVLSFAVAAVDRSISQEILPPALLTTIDSARTILSTVAGGLITSVTLLLSMMLVAVQLASSQFSPRTVRNWLGDKGQQWTIGVVVGTAIYCLLVLRSARAFGEATDGDQAVEIIPHLGVLFAVVLGVVSLILVVWSVDSLTDSLRIGRIGQDVMATTLATIDERNDARGPESEVQRSLAFAGAADEDIEIPASASPITTPRGGWIQQIDEGALAAAVPEGSSVWIVAALGTFALPDAPLAWTTADPDRCHDEILRAFAIGDERTLQQDVGFGILRLTDIAVRALSPGVNDPNTAVDMIVRLSVVLLRLWERDVDDSVRTIDGRRIIIDPLGHADFLLAAFDPILRYGKQDPVVLEALVGAVAALRSEADRRDLPGPLSPLDDEITELLRVANEADFRPSVHRSIRAAAAPQR